MAAKTIRMEQIRNLLQQKSKGISIRTIARNTGLSRNTVRHYLRANPGNRICWDGLPPMVMISEKNT